MVVAGSPIAIFGATGTVGTELLSRALSSGHRVRALTRRPEALRDHGAEPALEVVPGDVRDPSAVARTVAGCAAVLSALGAGRGDHPTTRRVGTANIVAAMRAEGIGRLVVMGGFHVHLPGDPGGLGQKLVDVGLRLTPGIDVPDTHGLVTTVVNSDRDWTLVRSARVASSKRPGGYRTGVLRIAPWNSVAPGDVADFMLRCLDDDAEVKRAPMVCA